MDFSTGFFPVSPKMQPPCRWGRIGRTRSSGPEGGRLLGMMARYSGLEGAPPFRSARREAPGDPWAGPQPITAYGPNLPRLHGAVQGPLDLRVLLILVGARVGPLGRSGQLEEDQLEDAGVLHEFQTVRMVDRQERTAAAAVARVPEGGADLRSASEQ